MPVVEPEQDTLDCLLRSPSFLSSSLLPSWSFLLPSCLALSLSAGRNLLSKGPEPQRRPKKEERGEEKLCSEQSRSAGPRRRSEKRKPLLGPKRKRRPEKEEREEKAFARSRAEAPARGGGEGGGGGGVGEARRKPLLGAEPQRRPEEAKERRRRRAPASESGSEATTARWRHPKR